MKNGLYIYIIVSAIMFWCVPMYGQVLLNNQKGIQSFEQLMFNKNILKEKRVRSIQTSFMIKKELHPIVKKPKITTYYEYNNQGDLTLYYKTFLLYDTNYDTVVEFYEYKNAVLTTKRETEYGKVSVYQYAYNDKGLVSKITKAQETNIGSSKLTHIPTQFTKKGEDNFQYHFMGDKSYVKYTLSVDNIRYQEQEVLYEKGKLKQDKTRLLYGQQKHNIYKYYYFESDLVKKEIVDNYTSTKKKHFIYRYFSDKNLSAIQTYNNEDKLTYTTEFLYKNNLLDAILKKNEATGTIEITKYKYEFY